MLTGGVSHPGPHTWNVDVLLGTTTGLLRLTDAGVAPLAATETVAMDGGWVIVEGAEVLSLDSGITATTAPLSATCVAARGEGALIGTEEAHLFEVQGSGSIEPVGSFDRIPTRDSWYTPWGAPPDTRSLTVTSDGTPLVNVHVGGVWRGDVDADEWIEAIPVDNDTHHVLASQSDSRVLVAAAVGFGWSTDGGRTFDWTTAGLHARYARAVAFAGSYAMVTASTGPRTNRGAVYRRPLDGDGPFERCHAGLPEWFEFNIDTFQLAARDESVAIGTADGDVYLSEDEGSTWALVADELPPIRCVAVG
jgi:hypothetical protein